jgi:hypothetical protein
MSCLLMETPMKASMKRTSLMAEVNICGETRLNTQETSKWDLCKEKEYGDPKRIAMKDSTIKT